MGVAANNSLERTRTRLPDQKPPSRAFEPILHGAPLCGSVPLSSAMKYAGTALGMSAKRMYGAQLRSIGGGIAELSDMTAALS